MLKIKKSSLNATELMIVTANCPYSELVEDLDLKSRFKTIWDLEGIGLSIMIMSLVIFVGVSIKENVFYTNDFTLQSIAVLIMVCMAMIIGYIIVLFEQIKLAKLQSMYHAGTLEIDWELTEKDLFEK